MASIRMMQPGSGSGFDPASRYDPVSMSRVALDVDPDDLATVEHGDIGDIGVDDDGTVFVEDEFGLTQPRDVRERGRRLSGWRRVACVTLCMGALVGAAVGIGLAVRGSGDDDEDSAGTVGGAKSTVLPPPPPHLGQTCSAASLATPVGHDACVDLCEAAACCTLYPDSDPLSCMSGNEEACIEYRSACVALEPDGGSDSTTDTEVVELPPPPADLTTMCSQSSVVTVDGFGACEEVCREARWCCGIDGSDGRCNAREHCSQYEVPCSSVGSFPSGPYVVATTTTTRATPTTVTATSSTAASANTEDTMTPQDLLQVAEQIVMKCSEIALDTETGRAECQSLCHSHMCCFEENPKYSCSDDDAVHCVAYAGCENLVSTDPSYTGNNGGSGTTISTAPTGIASSGTTFTSPKTLTTNDHQNLVEACSETSLSTLEGVQDCHSLCEARLCCFQVDGGEVTKGACYDIFPDECDTYEPCGALVSGASFNASGIGGEDTAVTAERVKSMCDASASEYLADCRALCGQHLCCFAPEGSESNCREEMGAAVCDGIYAECEILTWVDDAVGGSGGDGASGSGSDGSGASLPSWMEGMTADDACDVGGGDDTPSAECEALCATRSCCFKTGAGNCYPLNPSWCDEFKACLVLEGKKDMGGHYYGFEAPTTLNTGDHEALVEACSASSLTTLEGLQHCNSMCGTRLCCFSPDENESCKSEHKEECATYEPCQILVSPDHATSVAGSGVVTKEIVGEKCAAESVATAVGLGGCHALCADHLCCFAPEGTKSNCMDTLTAGECEMYEMCKILSDDGSDDGASIDGEASALVHEVCTANVTSDIIQKSKCESICEERHCCFQDGPGNCYPMNPDWCDEYNACEILDDLNTGGHYYEDLSNNANYYDEDQYFAGSTGGGQGSETTVLDTNLVEQVKELCKDSNLQDPHKVGNCEQVCSSLMCCFDTGSESCYEANKIECEEYTGCQQYHTFLNEQHLMGLSLNREEVIELCAPEKLQTEVGLAECQQVCDAHLCCFDYQDFQNNCLNGNEENCHKFAGCEQLHTFNDIGLS